MSINFLITANAFSNNIEHDEFDQSIEDSEYKDLITRLKEIKSSIVLLEKIISK